MKKIIPILLVLLIALPIANASTNKTCISPNTLQIIENLTLTTDGDAELIEISKEKHCPGGCINGECKPIQSSMPIEIYIFLCATAILIMLISFFKPDILIFKWIAVILFVALGAASFNLNRIYCEYTSSGWECYVHQYMAVNLAYLWFGLGAVMLVYAIISIIWATGMEVAKQTDNAAKS